MLIFVCQQGVFSGTPIISTFVPVTPAVGGQAAVKFVGNELGYFQSGTIRNVPRLDILQ